MKTIPLVRIVDDDSTIRKSLSFLLKSEGYEVQTFESAADFLSNEAQSRPGCVLLDVKMPGMSGTDLFLKLMDRNYPNPIIFLSAHGDIRLAVDMVKLGAMDFIEKPVEPESFVNLVAKACKLNLKTLEPIKADERELVKRAILSLSDREKEILTLVLENLSNREIGERLQLSRRTIEVHRASAYRKLDIHTTKDLKAIAQYLLTY